MQRFFWRLIGCKIALATAAATIAAVPAHAVATSLSPKKAPRPTALKAAPDLAQGDSVASIDVQRRHLLREALRTGSADALSRLDALPAPAGPASARADAALLRDLMLWRRLVDSDGEEWEAVDAFDKRRPGWPRMNQLRSRAEWKIPEPIAAARVLAFFSADEPQTARGMRLLGEALIATGQAKRGEEWIVRGWREEPASPAERRLFLATHSALLAEHHFARVDMLMRRQRYSAAESLAKERLSEGQQALIGARIALYRKRRGVDAAVGRVPQTLSDDPGLTHARALWRLHKNRNDEAEQLLREADAAQVIRDPALWSVMRMTLARDAFEDGRPRDAYAIAAPHGLTSGLRFAELEWFAGWMALRFLDAPGAALKHFETLWKGVSTPISRSRAAYWAGRAARAKGDAAIANAWFERAAMHPSAFYGQLAIEALGTAPAFTDAEGEPFALTTLTPTQRALYDAAELLYAAGMTSDARRFLMALAMRREEATALRRFIALAEAYGDGPGQIALGKVGRERGQSIWPALYPIPAQPSFVGRRVEPALLLGIARQESAFSESALSGAGAKGLMQLMTATARSTARGAGVQFDRARLTTDAEYNLNLGDAHLQDLLAAYEGSYPLTAAAYNAGGGNVGKWIERFGDPRSADVDMIDWIESIPFNETRNYVQRVLESVQVYRGRLAGVATPLSLTADLSK